MQKIRRGAARIAVLKHATPYWWLRFERAPRHLPLDAWIDTGNPLASVREQPRDDHVPYGLRAAVLCHFVDIACHSESPGAFAVLHISILEHSRVPAEK